jgi:hypothetical protein
MNSTPARKSAISKDDSCLSLGGFVSNWQLFYGQENINNAYPFLLAFWKILRNASLRRTIFDLRLVFANSSLLVRLRLLQRFYAFAEL